MFDAAYQGLWPTHDHKGNPISVAHGKKRSDRKGQQLCGPYKALFVESRGDYKFHKETYKIHSYNDLQCCHRCLARKTLGLSKQEFADLDTGFRAQLQAALSGQSLSPAIKRLRTGTVFEDAERMANDPGMLYTCTRAHLCVSCSVFASLCSLLGVCVRLTSCVCVCVFCTLSLLVFSPPIT